MTVFLTGGCGYVGSHTAVELLNAGYDVVIGDDFSNCSPDVPERIARIAGRPPRVYDLDVGELPALRHVFGRENIDCVIHFAGYKAVGESVQNPLLYYKNNLGCTIALLEAMAAFNVKNLIFSSSATVYGETASVPFTEETPTGGATNPYGWTKLMSEQIITDSTKALGLSAVLLRYFNPVGAHESGLLGENPNGIPNNLMPYIAQVAQGKLDKLTVYGDDYPTPDGTGVRDYIHVSDLALGHVKAVDYAQNHTGVIPINLGTGRGTSVLEMIHAFERASGKKIPYVIGPRRPGDIAVSYADPARAQALLGWTAQRSVEEMCRDAWNWQSRQGTEPLQS
jgi:UDP-glucose 4-epimerase